MAPFGKDFYRALMIGFLIGCVGMAMSVGGAAVHARASVASHAPGTIH